ncbi:hypothetical protein YPPY71_1669, partial [Yersinia pestis PY-71]
MLVLRSIPIIRL